MPTKRFFTAFLVFCLVSCTAVCAVADEASLTAQWPASGSGTYHIEVPANVVDAGDEGKFHLTGALTLSAWIHPRGSGSGSDAGIAGTGIDGFQLTHHGGHSVYGYIGGGDNSIGTPLATGSAHHVALSWDGTTGANGIKLYIDGELKAQRASAKAAIGKWNHFLIGNASSVFQGDIAAVRLYNRVLNAEEIAAQFQGDLQNATTSKNEPAQFYLAAQRREKAFMSDNLALGTEGAYAVTSSVLDLGANYSDNLLDGKLETAWQSFDADVPQWIDVHWEYPLGINRLVLAEAGESRIAALDVLAWRDEKWEIVKSLSAVPRNAGGDIEIAFPDVTTDRLRLEIKKNGGPYTRIAEIAAYGPVRLLSLRQLEPTWHATHIWSQEADESVKTEPRWFRKSFEVENFDSLQSAFIQARSNDYYQIFVNGQEVAEGSQKVVPYDITKLLRRGKNVLAVRCNVRRSPGWPWMSLLLETIINTAQGTQYVATDESWKVARTEQPGWNGIDFDDSTWEAIMAIGKVPIAPWGNIEYFNLGGRERVKVAALKIVPFRPQVGDRVSLEIHLQPQQPLSQRYAYALAIGEKTLNPSYADYQWAKAMIEAPETVSSNQPIVLKTSLRIPSYAPAGSSPIYLKGLGLQHNAGIEFVDANGKDLDGLVGEIQVLRPGMPSFQATKSFRLIRENGVFKFVVNGEKQVPLLWAFGNVTLPRIQHFSQTGIHLYHLQIYPFRVEANDVYDTLQFPHIDRHIRHLLRIDPQANFLIEMDVRESGVWDLRYPTEMMQSAFGKKESVSFASKKYAQDVSDYVRRLCRFLESKPYASHVIGYIPEIAEPESFMGGTGDNTFQTDRGKITIGDWSPQGIAYFRDFLREKYGNDVAKLRAAWNDATVTFETARPVQSELVREGENGGLFRDPTKGRMAFDLFECNTTMVPRFLLENIGRVVKEETKGRALVCSYYGYTLEHLRATNSPGTLLQGLHSYLYKALESPYLDCVMSPLQYDYSRFAGQKFTPFQPYATIRLHNKLYIAEMDYRTYVAYLRAYGRHRSAKETEAVLKRDLGTTIIQGSGAWFADWSAGTWGRSSVSMFDEKDILQTVQTMKDIYRKTRDVPRRSATQIAVIMSDKTPYYQDIYYGTALYRNLIDRMLFEELSQIGAPYDLYDIRDLDSDFVQKQYKLYIFLNPYFMTAHERERVQALKRDGKTLLWFYAPGYVSDENGLQLGGVEQLTGMKMSLSNRKERLSMQTVATPNPLLADIAPGTTMAMEEFSGDPITKQLHPIEFGPRFAVEDSAAATLAKYADGAVALAAKRGDNYNSIYSGVPFLSRAALRNIAAAAGVHLYAPLNVVVEADRNFLLLHNGFTGAKRFAAHLPEAATVNDLFTNKAVANKARQFQVDLPECSTQFYELK